MQVQFPERDLFGLRASQGVGTSLRAQGSHGAKRWGQGYSWQSSGVLGPVACREPRPALGRAQNRTHCSPLSVSRVVCPAGELSRRLCERWQLAVAPLGTGSWSLGRGPVMGSGPAVPCLNPSKAWWTLCFRAGPWCSAVSSGLCGRSFAGPGVSLASLLQDGVRVGHEFGGLLVSC